MTTLSPKWNTERETYLLNLMCFHRPLGKNASENYSIIEQKFSEKYNEEKFTMDDIKNKIEEYYDMTGLYSLDLKESDNDSQKAENKNLNAECKVPEENDDVEKEDAMEKKPIKHVTIDEEKNKVFTEQPSIDDSQEDSKQSNESSEELSDETKRSTELKEADDEHAQEEEQVVASKVNENGSEEMIFSKKDIAEEVTNIVNDKEEIENGEPEAESSETVKRDVQEDKEEKDKEEKEEEEKEEEEEEEEEKEEEKREEKGEEEEEEEEPAHLTRAQARKLHINVEKETIDNEKKTHDIEEARRTKSKEDSSNPEVVESVINEDVENVTVINSEAEEDTSTPKKRGRKKVKSDDITPRRSTRLRRRSDQDEEENGETENAEEAVGKRTRSSSNNRGSIESNASTNSVEVETPRRGRKRKNAVNTSITDISSRKTRSKRRNGSDTEGNTDEDGDADGNEDSAAEEDVEEEEEDQEEDEGKKLRRSSRKRQNDVDETTPTPVTKKQKVLAAVAVPKRRGRRPKKTPETAAEEEEDGEDGDDDNLGSEEPDEGQGVTTRRTRRGVGKK